MRAEATSNSGKPNEKTTTRSTQYISPPLVLRGGFVAKRVRENLLRKVAPVYGQHYENGMFENGIENLAFENLTNRIKS